MITIKEITNLDALSRLKQQYFQASIAPLDGQLHLGFVPMAVHYGFYLGAELVGFCCINEQGEILQFHLPSSPKVTPRELFTLVAKGRSTTIGKVKGALVSTSEPDYLALCVDNATNIQAHSLLFQQPKAETPVQQGCNLSIATPAQLSQFVTFAVENIDAPQDWVTGYFNTLIQRQELFGYWHNEQLLASGECRLFDHIQTDYADLGVIVAIAERGKGTATQVLRSLIWHANTQDRLAIASALHDNIGSQKALTAAGLVANHRLVRFAFSPT